MNVFGLNNIKKEGKIIQISGKYSTAKVFTDNIDQETILQIKYTLDEAPMAYKPMEEIINNIKDTVHILDIIKPIYNFKASE